MATEFELIERHFTRPAKSVLLGVGDDCALLKVADGLALAISTDMLVEGTHFFAGAEPRLLGHKALAVNLSDIAAMGADPRWVTLAIALPQADEAWVAAFAAGFFALADRFGVELIGGDTTRGPLTLSLTILGTSPPGLALRRDGARAGDDIWISGSTGDAALAVAHRRGEIVLEGTAFAHCAERLDTPEPRVALGRAIRAIATAAIDVSDGLVADLGHICKRSRLGAELILAEVPRSAALRACVDQARAGAALLAGGDDYELVFTAPPGDAGSIEAAAARVGVPVTRIGRMVAAAGGQVRVLGPDGEALSLERPGFDHFGR